MSDDPTRPLVSIITPTYNHAAFVGRCLESVLGQSYTNWEQIVIDDGSTDNTEETVGRYHDRRIRYISQPNQGPFELASTYNRALSLANGELIAILEGDDFWSADKLEIQVAGFRDTHVVLSHGEVADVDAKGQIQRTRSRATTVRERVPEVVKRNEPAGLATRYMLSAEGRAMVCPASVMIRRTALEQVGGFQSVVGLPLTDYPTFMELSLLGEFHYSVRVLGYRRRHEKSITVNYSRQIHEKVSEFALRFVERHEAVISISDTELVKFKKTWRDAESAMHFSEGRSLLLQQCWAEARSHFRRSMWKGRPALRLASFAGLLCSWLRCDLESVMRLSGRCDLTANTKVSSAQFKSATELGGQ